MQTRTDNYWNAYKPYRPKGQPIVFKGLQAGTPPKRRLPRIYWDSLTKLSGNSRLLLKVRK